MTKNEKIKETRKLTKERRSKLRTKVYTLKVDKSHLSTAKVDQLERLFLEGKWLYNHLLATNDIFNQNTTGIKVVKVKNREGVEEERELKVIGSQIKQEILQQIKQDIYNLAKAKKAGRKVGRLKFKQKVCSLKLKQPEVTWKLNGNYFGIQGVKGSLKV